LVLVSVLHVVESSHDWIGRSVVAIVSDSVASVALASVVAVSGLEDVGSSNVVVPTLKFESSVAVDVVAVVETVVVEVIVPASVADVSGSEVVCSTAVVVPTLTTDSSVAVDMVPVIVLVLLIEWVAMSAMVVVVVSAIVVIEVAVAEIPVVV
jgi:hypothetical protein